MITPVDRNWIRWISASIAKHFDDIVSPTLHLYIEGQPRQTEGKQNYIELRYDGPHCTRLSPLTFKLYITINTLIVSIKDGQSNIYEHENHLGLALTAFTNAITIFKYGDDPTSELGCMKLKPDPMRDIITISRFEQSIPSISVREASIEAEYEMIITP